MGKPIFLNSMSRSISVKKVVLNSLHILLYCYMYYWHQLSQSHSQYASAARRGRSFSNMAPSMVGREILYLTSLRVWGHIKKKKLQKGEAILCLYFMLFFSIYYLICPNMQLLESNWVFLPFWSSQRGPCMYVCMLSKKYFVGCFTLYFIYLFISRYT